jgi:hypothetical protein
LIKFEIDRVWGVNCGACEPKYQSWRDMYLQRPRLRYNGCYISKTSYIRDGENSFQDRFYRPWHLVEYFRYLRYVISLRFSQYDIMKLSLYHKYIIR